MQLGLTDNHAVAILSFQNPFNHHILFDHVPLFDVIIL